MLRGAIFVAFLSLISYLVFKYLVLLDLYKHGHKHYPGPCRRVKGARHGSEDMAWTSDGLAFITTGLPFPDLEQLFNATGTHGEIQLFDFKNPSAGVVDLKIQPTKGFAVDRMRPHGITVLEDRVKRKHLLYVINHIPDQALEQVEKFQFDPTARQLVHLKSIDLPRISFANDLSVLEEDKFYITNFILFKNNFALELLQYLFPLRLGAIFYYNGAEDVEVASSINMPNGICLSKDNRFLYAASTLEETLRVYKRDSATNKLDLVQTVFLGNKLDNINLSQKGDALLIGTHPLYYKSMLHTLAPLAQNNPCPSSILRVPLGSDGLVDESEITELFYDHGELISGSSSAAVFDGQLLIGSVAHSLVHCELKEDV